MKLEGNNIYIRFLEEGDAEAVLDLQLRNKEFFQKYVSTRNGEFYTLEVQKRLIGSNNEQSKRDEKYSFGIFQKNNDTIIGNIALTEVFRGPLQSCYIGYYLDLECNGKGYMTEAVRLAVKFGFEDIKLHRIEAGVMPRNLRSMRVLEKAGFIKEGIARKNVNINGKWEDHQVLAILDEDYKHIKA